MSNDIYCCSECGKTYTTKKSFGCHIGSHSKKNIEIRQERKNKITDYYQNPTLCLQCQKPISYEKRHNKFCNHSCSASFTNLLKPPKSEEQCKKISNSIKKYHFNNKAKRKSNASIIYLVNKAIKYAKKESIPFSLLNKCCCSHCQKIFLERLKLKYCKDCRHLYSIYNRNQYKFTFNVYHYPELFDLELLNKIGFYSPGGKSGKWNINGISRDHKISVNESIKNNYDPFYIRHPLNCELMPHLENNKKKTKSSITYNELKHQVDLYESLN